MLVHNKFNVNNSFGFILIVNVSVNSKVLSTALGEMYLEGQTNRIKMMFSTCVVKALLKHQYYRSVDAAAESCSIALDLLRLSDYYDVPCLWNDVVAVFVASDHDWFELTDVFETFNFVAKCIERYDSAAKLIDKLMHVFVV